MDGVITPDELDRQFGIPGVARVCEGNGALSRDIENRREVPRRRKRRASVGMTTETEARSKSNCKGYGSHPSKGR